MNNRALQTLLATAALNLCLLALVHLTRALHKRWVLHRVQRDDAACGRIQSASAYNYLEGR